MNFIGFEIRRNQDQKIFNKKRLKTKKMLVIFLNKL